MIYVILWVKTNVFHCVGGSVLFVLNNNEWNVSFKHLTHYCFSVLHPWLWSNPRSVKTCIDVFAHLSQTCFDKTAVTASAKSKTSTVCTVSWNTSSFVQVVTQKKRIHPHFKRSVYHLCHFFCEKETHISWFQLLCCENWLLFFILRD